MWLQIKHIGTSSDNTALFVVMCEGKQSQPVALTPPKEITVGKYNTNLQDLQWYLEDYMELPIGTYRIRAEAVQTALSQWGRDCFEALFASSPARDWYFATQQEDLTNLQLVIVSDDPAVLSWPWEALKTPDNNFIAQHCPITRQIETDKIKNTQPLSDTFPYDKL
ncbi:MAG: hypothetical protein LBI79_10765, partial [Nitrososphaerota archaeon]|nr:hypothetical protein [Nitrososphaerota archaeon]